MFMSDVHKKDEIRSIATQDLRKLGVKCRPKKSKSQQINRHGSKVFNVPLSALPTQIVTLNTGQQICVPKLVHELCSLIMTDVQTEGIFRKEGSRSRQNEIKIILDAGCALNEDHHVIDIAVILKKFFRQLPEPLIPYGYHELFLRCVLLENNKLKAILLACLLLPPEHLNTLSYLMQFFYEVSANAPCNKMTPYNIAVVIGPTVFPAEEKTSFNPQLRLTKTCELFKLLIENAQEIGVLPETVIEQVGNIKVGGEDDKRRKKRRSGSLTRMFNGLKKMVAGKTIEEDTHMTTPDLLTPVARDTKKRKLISNGLSNKKRKDVMTKLPDNALLNTPFTPHRTPVNMNSSVSSNNKQLEDSTQLLKERKAQWFSRSRSIKNLKQEEYQNAIETNLKPKGLERRWSTVNQICNLRKNKKRNSCVASLAHVKEQIDTKRSKVNNNNNNVENMQTEPDYVRVSKTDFEEFINKVSAIEQRISTFELENVQSKEIDQIKNVQTAYEQTLVQIEPLSPTTDHLAKRLSRDLKIRRSAEQKIIRSPSARKIGSIRRRSREMDRGARVTRHRSWHVTRETSQRVPLNPKMETPPVTNIESQETNTKADQVVVNEISCNRSGSSSDNWVSAEGFFTTPNKKEDSSNSFNSRASLARLRNQNAGMVLAKAKLFDGINSNSPVNQLIPRVKIHANSKIGAARNLDSRLSYRVRTLKYEERRLPKKSISPRKRTNLSQRQKLQIAKQIIDTSRNDSEKENVPIKDCSSDIDVDMKKFSTPRTPRSTPRIKKSLHVKSPKRLCRTPRGLDRSTPLKVLVTPVRNNLI